jgi:excisionase family DNA binding protein
MPTVEMLTLEEAAVRGKTSGRMIRNLVKRGVLPAVRYSQRTLRIPSDALDRFIKARLVEAETTRAANAAQRHAALAARRRAS